MLLWFWLCSLLLIIIIISVLSFIANFLASFAFYFGLPCLFPPNSKNPSASSPLFLHSPVHNSPTTPPTTIELLKGKEGDLKKKKFNPKKRERDTHTNTQRSFTRESCWCFVCIFFISFWIVGWIFRVKFFCFVLFGFWGRVGRGVGGVGYFFFFFP